MTSLPANFTHSHIFHLRGAAFRETWDKTAALTWLATVDSIWMLVLLYEARFNPNCLLKVSVFQNLTRIGDQNGLRIFDQFFRISFNFVGALCQIFKGRIIFGAFSLSQPLFRELLSPVEHSACLAADVGVLSNRKKKKNHVVPKLAFFDKGKVS